MATEAQVLANRLNARKSTGPRTVEGKAVVAQNAVKHGLLAQKAVIVGEDLGEFGYYRGEMLGELAPAGAMESMLAERVVSLSWRLRRAERVQNEAFDALLAKDSASPLARLTQSLRPRSDFGTGEGDSALGRVVVSDFGNGRVLDRLLMYERRIEHSLYRTMTELQRLRLLRELEPAMEQPTRQGGCWGKPQPTAPSRERGKPTRQDKCWGKAQPTAPSRAMGESTRQDKCWGKPQPTAPSRAMGESTRQDKCWGKPQPTTASEPACFGEEDPSRQTKPIGREGNSENRPCDAKEREFAPSVSREPAVWANGNRRDATSRGPAACVAKLR